MERVACVQLVKQLKTNNLYEILQSAFKQLHSTETVLLRVQNDLLQAVDNEGGAISVLLDLSAAFETIDHEKLLNLLNQPGGIRGVALKWFESYLKNRTQTVQIRSCTSTPVTLKYWVPQGSVLSLILLSYLLCAQPPPPPPPPLAMLFENMGWHDDVIKWKHFPRNWPFVREIHRSPVNFPHKGQWRGALMFSLIYAWINDWVNNREAGDLRRQHGHYDVIVMNFHLYADDTQLYISFQPGVLVSKETAISCVEACIKDKKIWLANNLLKLNDDKTELIAIKSQNQHISKNIGSSLITPSSEPPRNLGVFFFTRDVFSMTTRMLSLRCKFDNITQVLIDLHWLPVEQRIENKVVLLFYKALLGKAPAYISPLLSLYTPTRPLRSETKSLLRVPICRLEGFGRRRFSYAAPSLWNPLPTPVKCASSIDTFKGSLEGTRRILQLLC